MYGGGLLLALAWSLVSSPVALAPTAVASLFLDAKRRLEESWLAEEQPEYEAYRQEALTVSCPSCGEQTSAARDW